MNSASGRNVLRVCLERTVYIKTAAIPKVSCLLGSGITRPQFTPVSTVVNQQTQGI
jgi:hypothetical protein